MALGKGKKKKKHECFQRRKESSGHGFGLLKELSTMLQGEAHSDM